MGHTVFLMLDTIGHRGLWWKTNTKLSSKKRVNITPDDSTNKINKDGVVVTFKALVRLLNFILFLLAVSFLTSQSSRAASVEIVSDTHQSVTHTETTKTNQSTTVSIDDSSSSSQKELITTTQSSDTGSVDDGSTIANSDEKAAPVDGPASITTLSDSPSKTVVAPPVSHTPARPMVKSVIYTPVHNTMHVPLAVASVVPPVQKNQSPTIPTNPSDTNVLNTSALIIPMALAKQILHELVHIPTHIDYTVLAELMAALTVSALGVMVASMLSLWISKGFAQVVSPRGQTNVWFDMGLSEKINERATFGRNALFNTLGVVT